MVKFQGVAGWEYQNFVFTINGAVTTGTKIDGSRYVPRNYTITKVVLHVETNGGASGNTIIDVNKNGTTLFTVQANRPTVAWDAGDDITEEVSNMDITAIEGADILTMDVDTVVVGGTVSNIQVTVVARGRGGG